MSYMKKQKTLSEDFAELLISEEYVNDSVLEVLGMNKTRMIKIRKLSDLKITRDWPLISQWLAEVKSLPSSISMSRDSAGLINSLSLLSNHNRKIYIMA